MVMRPSTIIHGDWSCHASKRWIATATLHENKYRVESVRLAGDFLDDIRSAANKAPPVLLGFDFPIGLPRAYARRAGIKHFLDALRTFGSAGTEWSEFYVLADNITEVSICRPYYPNRQGRKGEKPQKTWLSRLGLAREELLRRCERRHADRKEAGLLFWTTGGKQPGRAAIHGWSELISPLLGEPTLGVSIWPFQGRLDELLRGSSIVVCETYPAEVYRWPGLDLTFGSGRGEGKRSQKSRRANASKILQWLADNDVEIDRDVERRVHDGFGSSWRGEDAFDALVGLLGMLAVVRGRDTGEPDDGDVRTVEGWILGQANGRTTD